MSIPHLSERGRRFRLALGTSFLSKLLGAGVQVLSLPILLDTLGKDRFAAYLALTAFVAWIAPLGMGVLPALTRQIAMASARADRRLEASLFGAGFWFVLIVGLLITLFSLIFAALGNVEALIGHFPTIADSEIRIGLALAMAFTGAYFFGNTSVAVRAGYQEYHVSNNLSVIANIVTIVLILLLSGRGVDMGHFVVAIYAPLTVLVLLDLGRIMRTRSYLAPPRIPRLADLEDGDLKHLFRTSGSAWIGQIHGFIVAHASVLVVAHLFTPSDTAGFGAMMRAMLLVNAVVGLYIWPLIPAVTDASTRGDGAWALKSYRRSLLMTLALAGGAAIVVAFGGNLIMQIWLGPQISVPLPMSIGFALFFLGFNVTFFGFNLCLSVGETRFLGLSYIVEILLFGLLSVLLMPVFGASALALALGIASVSLNAWLLPWRSWKRISIDLQKGLSGV